MTTQIANAGALSDKAAELPPLAPGEMDQVQGVFTAFEKMLRVYRLYPPNNRIFIDFADDLANRFSRILAIGHELEIDVEEGKFLYKGRVVFEDADRERSFPTHLYRDGIRRLAFYEGLTREEILSFLSVVSRRPSPDDLEDDLVTLLWAQDFAHISYFVLDDPFDDESAPDLSNRVREPGTEQATDAITTETSRRDRLLAGGLSAKSLSQVLTISDHDLQAIKAMIAHESTRNIRHDLTTLLFELLVLAETTPLFEKAVGILGQLVRSYLVTSHLPDALEVMRKFHELLGARIPHERAEIVHRELERITSPESLTETSRLLEQAANPNVSEFAAFYRMIGPPAIPVLLRQLPRSRHPQVLTSLVAELARSAPERLLDQLGDSDPIVLRSVIAALAALGDPSLAPSILPHVGNPTTAVRLEAVRALSQLGGPACREGLAKALADPEYQVRIHALRCIEEMRIADAVPLVEALTTARDFQSRNLYEKQETFRVVARVGGASSIPFLLDAVMKKGILRRAREEEVRACAAGALAAIPDQQGREMLERFARTESRVVRDACEIALRRLRSEAEAAAAGEEAR